MIRSSKPERAQRINTALDFIKSEESLSSAAVALAIRYHISKRQAYRYVREAKAGSKPIPIPEQKITFSVKLSHGLIRALRQRAKSSGKTISEIVTQAVEAFLSTGRGRG